LRIDIVFPVLPPVLNGIGDYTIHLSQALASRGCDVRVLTAQDEVNEYPDIEVEQAFSLRTWTGLFPLIKTIRSNLPDWLIVQFEQFAYGRWGFNPLLPMVLWYIQRTLPEVRIAVMFHEDFVPATNWKNAVMTTWQRVQFWTLGRLADVAGFSIQTWATRYQSWFRNTDVAHWPVGSNIPHVGVSYATARDQLGIKTSTFVAGIFGSLRASRMVDWICCATHALAQQAEDFTLLYVGPHGAALQEALPDIRIRNAGPLPAEEVSVHLSAMDLHLAPFIDGASTRRGSFLAGLQHGVPTVSTRGPLTDSMLEDENGNAFMLVPVDAPDGFKQVAIALQTNPKRRQAMREQSQLFFEKHFKWSLVADEILPLLNSASTKFPPHHA